MMPELHSLLSKVKEPEKVARLFDRVADRLDEIVADRLRESAERRSGLEAICHD